MVVYNVHLSIISSEGKAENESIAILDNCFVEKILPKSYQLKFIFGFLFLSVILTTQLKWLVGIQVILKELMSVFKLEGKGIKQPKSISYQVDHINC
jgi:hypothetical protein